MRTTSVPTGLLRLISAGEMSGNFWSLERTVEAFVSCRLWGPTNFESWSGQSFARKELETLGQAAFLMSNA